MMNEQQHNCQRILPVDSHGFDRDDIGRHQRWRVLRYTNIYSTIRSRSSPSSDSGELTPGARIHWVKELPPPSAGWSAGPQPGHSTHLSISKVHNQGERSRHVPGRESR